MTIEEAKYIARIIIIGSLLIAYLLGWSAAIILRIKNGTYSSFWELWTSIHIGIVILIFCFIFICVANWAFT